MITNCELPLCMLVQDNFVLNDYDFILLHMMLDHPSYQWWAQDLRHSYPERMMILDNSAYEFFVKGETLDMDKFVAVINELKPDYYILPDVLRDKQKTLEGVETFLKKYKTPYSKPLAVAQGNSSEELVECLIRYAELGIDYVGVPFHLSFYTEMEYDEDIVRRFMTVYNDKETEDIRYAMGRVQWVREHENLLKSFQKVHMLGSHCPYEKKFYHDFYSMDTGYPVKLGYKGIRLEEEEGKPNIIIDDFFKEDLSNKQIMQIHQNVQRFRNY